MLNKMSRGKTSTFSAGGKNIRHPGGSLVRHVSVSHGLQASRATRLTEIIPIKINTCAASANAKAKQTITYILYNALERYAMRIRAFSDFAWGVLSEPRASASGFWALRGPLPDDRGSLWGSMEHASLVKYHFVRHSNICWF